jgi:hypothetical protein
MLSQNNNFSGFYFDDNPSDEFMPFNGKAKMPSMPIQKLNRENGSVYLSEPFLTYYLDKLNLNEDEDPKKDFIMHGPKMPVDAKNLDSSPQVIQKDRESSLFFNSKDNDDSQSVVSLANTSDMSIDDLESIDSSSNSDLSFNSNERNERELPIEGNIQMGEQMAFDFKNWLDNMISSDKISDNKADLSVNKKNIIISGVYLDDDPGDAFNSKNLFALTFNDKKPVENILSQNKRLVPITVKKKKSPEYEIISGIYMENESNEKGIRSTEITASLGKEQSQIKLPDSRNIFALTVKEKSANSKKRNKDLGVVFNDDTKILALLPINNYDKLNKLLDTSQIFNAQNKGPESILEVNDTKKIMDYLKSSVDKIFQHKINDNNPQNEVDKMIEMAAIMVNSAATPDQKSKLLSDIVESLN